MRAYGIRTEARLADRPGIAGDPLAIRPGIRVIRGPRRARLRVRKQPANAVRGVEVTVVQPRPRDDRRHRNAHREGRAAGSLDGVPIGHQLEELRLDLLEADTSRRRPSHEVPYARECDADAERDGHRRRDRPGRAKTLQCERDREAGQDRHRRKHRHDVPAGPIRRNEQGRHPECEPADRGAGERAPAGVERPPARPTKTNSSNGTPVVVRR